MGFIDTLRGLFGRRVESADDAAADAAAAGSTIAATTPMHPDETGAMTDTSAAEDEAAEDRPGRPLGENNERR
jgi:hypothetical protein